MLEILKEVVVKEKHPDSSFLALSVCNNHHVWLILSFEIESKRVICSDSYVLR